MEIVTGIMDSTPGLGQAIAGVHYCCGNRERARKAWFRSNRSTAVVVGGLVGSTCGPVTAVTFAITAGVTMDAAGSEKQSQGVIKDFEDTKNDFNSGKFPFEPVARAAGTVALDSGLTGLSWAGKKLTGVIISSSRNNY